MKITYSILISIICFWCFSCNNNSDNASITDNPENKEYPELTSDYGVDSLDSWGIGLISNINYNSAEMLNFPYRAINVYDAPNGNKVGELYRITDKSYGLLLNIYADDTAKRINRKDYVSVTYEGQNLKYYSSNNNYYQCFIHSVDNGLWISKEELVVDNFEFIDWENFIVASNRRLHPLDFDETIPLIDSNMQIVDSLNRYVNEIIIISEKHQNKYKVDIYNLTECDGGDGKKIGSAWIEEIIDKNGHPIVFFFTSC